MKLSPIVVVISVILIFACAEDQDLTDEPMYEIGKNRYTAEVDGNEREYYVHVPESYIGNEDVPVVFMLHGTSGDGLRFYNISGWKEVGEKENLLTVFPSSWHYCIIDGNRQKNTTKWNIFPSKSWTYCQGETPKDDIKFLHTIIEDLKNKFSINDKRIYLAGFSNGGRMAFRVAVEMSDIFAAITQNSGSYSSDTVFTPERNIPLMMQFGNSEDGLNGSEEGSLPMHEFDRLLNENEEFINVRHTHVNTFKLDPNYTIKGNINKFVTARFEPKDPDSDHEFLFRMVKGLEHQYPNGNNHPMKAAEMQWEWMQQFQLPQ